MVKKSVSYCENIITKFIKAPVIEKILYLLVIIIIVNLIANYVSPIKENFSQKNNFIIKKNKNIYDDFYVNIYDDLYYDKIKTEYEIGSILNCDIPTEESIILDVGSGTGHHVNILASNDVNVIGIDDSAAMITKARENYPTLEFKQENVLNRDIFGKSYFTHITCFNFTIYHFDNKRAFFENCYYWLKPGGFLIVNLVDKKTFDPILRLGNPYEVLGKKNIEKYGNETRVKLLHYDYKSNFEIYPNDDTAVFNERIKNVKTGDRRKQEMLLYMPTQKKILNEAKSTGFILESQYDMSGINVHSQYIYTLKKPN